ncbi:MAG: hypothetical protein ACI9W7_001673, partial [Porticoccaceae bacterium]
KIEIDKEMWSSERFKVGANLHSKRKSLCSEKF